jgi:myo-inositol-1(or 4)-monophosphatase
VARLVQSESVGDDEGTWHERKRKSIDRIKEAPLDGKIVAMGDKLSNMRAIARDYAQQGDKLWSLFHANDPKDHEWHYRALADALRDLKDTFAFQEFETLINQVFGNR